MIYYPPSVEKERIAWWRKKKRERNKDDDSDVGSMDADGHR